MNVYQDMTARKVEEYADKTGRVWFRRWELFVDDSRESQGSLVFNDQWLERDYHGKYAVYINSSLGKDYGLTWWQSFRTREEALKKARIEIENKPALTAEMISDAIAKLKESRYQTEMSDDFAYSNGSIDRIDCKINHLKRMLSSY